MDREPSLFDGSGVHPCSGAMNLSLLMGRMPAHLCHPHYLNGVLTPIAEKQTSDPWSERPIEAKVNVTCLLTFDVVPKAKFVWGSNSYGGSFDSGFTVPPLRPPTPKRNLGLSNHYNLVDLSARFRLKLCIGLAYINFPIQTLQSPLMHKVTFT